MSCLQIDALERMAIPLIGRERGLDPSECEGTRDLLLVLGLFIGCGVEADG